MKFFTSDHHFDHANILRYTQREFKNVKEMGDAYIEQWNSQAGDNDTVIHLGDFCLGRLALAETYFNQLQGTIHIVPGNHDDRWVNDYWKERRDNTEFNVFSASNQPITVLADIAQTRIKDHKVILCHYPLRSWRASYHGSWHLYGHVHGHIDAWGLSMDVGVDNAEGVLHSEENIVRYMFIRQKCLDSLEKQ